MARKVYHCTSEIVSEEANYRRLEGEDLDKFNTGDPKDMASKM